MYSSKSDQLAAAKDYYYSKSEKGECRRCCQPPVLGKRFCQYHLDIAKKYHAKRSLKTRRAQQIKRHHKNLELRKEVLMYYGGSCCCCGETQYEFLTFDHTDGSGADFRREYGAGNLARKLKKLNYPKNIRVLCWNCNCSLAIYGTCPHSRITQTTNHPLNKFKRTNII